MAIFHLNAKVISRGKGQSAIAAAAYRSGEPLRDEQDGTQKNYSREQRVLSADIMAPKDAPEWAHDRNQLWNHAERAEKRKDAQLAREIEVSLPHELTPQQREWLVRDFAREAFVRKGYAVDFAFHAPEPGKDDRNHHAHLMVTMRTLGSEGFAAKKDPSMNRREQLSEWRGQWAWLANRHLARHGHKERIDHRSLKEQGQDREPTIHLGYAAKEIAARGGQSDRVDTQLDIIEHNGVRTDIIAIDRELRRLEKTEAEQAAARAQEAKAATPPPAYVPYGPYASIESIMARHTAAEAELKRSREQAAKTVSDKAPQPPKAAEPVKAPPVAPEGKRKGAASGLQVMDKASGIVFGLGDFMAGLLAGASAGPKPRDFDVRASVTDPAARKEQQLARLAAHNQEREASKALDRIADDMAAGRALKSEDIRSLTREHQEQISMRGDDGLRQMVEEARKHSERYWKGDERER